MNQKKQISTGFFIFFVVGCLAVLSFVIYRLSQKIYSQNEIDKEIAGLEKEIAKLEQGNEDLNILMNYLQMEEFKEKEAKDKLNLIKEGEEVVLVKEPEILGAQDQKEEAENQAEVIVHRSNYYWWWHYFFSLAES